MASPETRKQLLVAFAACEDKKGEDTRILELDPADSGLADFFLITSASNDRQVVAIADEIEFRLKKECGVYATSVEGRRQGEWILLDYHDIVIHVFLAEKRAFYDIERLRKSARNMTPAEVEEDLKAALLETLKEKTKEVRTHAPGAKSSAKKAPAKKTAVKRPAGNKLAVKRTPVKAKSEKGGSTVSAAPAKKIAKKAAKKAPAKKTASAAVVKKTAAKKAVPAKKPTAKPVTAKALAPSSLAVKPPVVQAVAPTLRGVKPPIVKRASPGNRGVKPPIVQAVAPSALGVKPPVVQAKAPKSLSTAGSAKPAKAAKKAAPKKAATGKTKKK